MDIDQLKNHIHSFTFEKCKNGSQGFVRILIQLFGFLGHGKSSFINSCIYVLSDGEYQNWAKAREGDGGITTERISYRLTGNITLVDNRGCKQLSDYETGEIFAQLSNLLPLGKTVEFNQGFTLIDRIIRAQKSLQTSDFVFPVFVHSVKRGIPPEDLNDLKFLLTTARKLSGVFPIVALTHKTSGRLTTTESIFRDMGVERIFSFENYTIEDHFKTRGRHEEVLKFVHEVIKDVQFRVEHQPRDPTKEMMERRQFIMNYIHECGKKAEQENIERQKAMEKALLERKKKLQEEEMRRRIELERQAQSEELMRKREVLERQRKAEKARLDDELHQQEKLNKKNKKKCCLFG
ncbi:uncharacterized protein [Hyperolius riggenbachi]|uniref:uncharacterized protein n=1 Tax=Hyperolius riggenbachi TaxID=752182 RepID=UPI0035A34B2C